MARLTLDKVEKTYDKQRIIHGVDLDIQDGEFTVLVGPSGCGKSTLLRMIAGLEEISSGTICIDDRVVNEVAPAQREVAMVFQSYALYPHMTVYNNMAFGLKQAKTPKPEIERRVRQAAEALQITDYLERQPKHLSGGQRQRVAIGRAIVRDPEIFLFDEPLSNLDAALRVQTRLEIARLHQRLQSTMVYVTHDQVEAMTLADKIVVLRAGYVEQVGSPLELYQRPANRFVAQFIGNPRMNLFSREDLTALGQAQLAEHTQLGIRPEHLECCDEADALIAAKVEFVEQLGEYVLAHMQSPAGQALIAKMPARPDTSGGRPVYLNAAPEHQHLFELDSGRRIPA